mmetsp:Transcript_1655/g.3581  ORF Transcript_1655/g.3581 Transcript_1655/m.3581 type:complete len:84 (-) Transcript_1655:848-1099(-)
MSLSSTISSLVASFLFLHPDQSSSQSLLSADQQLELDLLINPTNPSVQTAIPVPTCYSPLLYPLLSSSLLTCQRVVSDKQSGS